MIKAGRNVFARLVRQVDDQPLGPSADGPRQVELGGGRPASGQDELRQRRQLGLQGVDGLSEPRDVLVADRLWNGPRGFGIGQRRADGEELVLELGRQGVGRESSPWARTTPSTAFSSSTVP